MDAWTAMTAVQLQADGSMTLLWQAEIVAHYHCLLLAHCFSCLGMVRASSDDGGDGDGDGSNNHEDLSTLRVAHNENESRVTESVCVCDERRGA